jgi:hypothetical protein
MAKKVVRRKKRAEGAPTKASVIREIHEADKSLGPSAVARAAAEKLGIKVSPTLVSQASSIMNKKGGMKKRGRKKKATARATTPSSGSLAHDLMEAAKGVEVAIQHFAEQASAAISAKIRQMILPNQK